MDEFSEILASGQLDVVFQPIRDLGTQARVGYEALIRGPAGSALERASALLAKAYETDRVVEFDWMARACACRAALRAELDPDLLLFLNIEPLALGSTCPPELLYDIEQAFSRYQVVLEITERSLERDPASLLDGIAVQRPTVAGLAIDDLGAQQRSLALLPTLAPDIIKLDLTVTQAGPSPAVMSVLDIAYEETERTGATILAEGVETADHAEFARSIGAKLVQGQHLGEPAALPPGRTWSAPGWQLGAVAGSTVDTPFDALRDHTTGRADAELLFPLGRQLAYRSVRLREPAVVLVLVPDAGKLATTDKRCLSDLARRGVITAALGPGLSKPPAAHVRGGPLRDPRLAGQWAIITLAPGVSSALLARAVDDEDGDFEYAVTHDRGRVIAAASSLLRRLGTD